MCVCVGMRIYMYVCINRIFKDLSRLLANTKLIHTIIDQYRFDKQLQTIA